MYAKWIPNTYTNKLTHQLRGFKYSEGNNADKALYQLQPPAYIKVACGNSYTIDESLAITPPNGYYFSTEFFLSNQSGSYVAYNMGQLFTQGAGATDNYFYYHPYDYTITYDLDGGTNNAENPSSYNVLYGVSLKEPTKEGTKFLGWYIGDTKVTGINEGQNATFESTEDLYAKLATRTTGDITLTARWDAPPTITGVTKEYYEGETVTKADLMKDIVANDDEEGDISNKMIITKIEYPAGKIENGQSMEGYVTKYPSGMQDTDTLDTWFLKMKKEDSPVTIKVTYKVEDRNGNVTEETFDVLLKYNEFPKIESEDRYFTVEEAQAGIITEDLLTKEAIATGELKATDTEEGDLSSKVEIVGFKPEDFTGMTGDGFVTITYKVTDSMGPDGKGKETIHQIKVYVISGFVDDGLTDVFHVRFISKKFYDLNKGLDWKNMSDEEKAAYNSNGGLNVESYWYIKPEYASMIEASFGKTTGTTYSYTLQDIENIRAYVDAHGIGNSQEDGALDGFAAQFMD